MLTSGKAPGLQYFHPCYSFKSCDSVCSCTLNILTEKYILCMHLCYIMYIKGGNRERFKALWLFLKTRTSVKPCSAVQYSTVWGVKTSLAFSFSTNPTKDVRSISTGCPCLSYRANTKWKKLDLRRFEGGCFSKWARARPTPLHRETERERGRDKGMHSLQKNWNTCLYKTYIVFNFTINK